MTEYRIEQADGTARVFRSHKYPWGTLHRAVQMRLDDADNPTIMEATGMTEGTLARLFRVLDLADTPSTAAQKWRSREAGRDYAALSAEAVRLHEAGCSQHQIRDELDVSYRFIRGALDRAGRRPRSRSAALRLHYRQERQSSAEVGSRS